MQQSSTILKHTVEGCRGSHSLRCVINMLIIGCSRRLLNRFADGAVGVIDENPIKLLLRGKIQTRSMVNKSSQ